MMDATQQNRMINAKMPSTIHSVRPTPFFGGATATGTAPLDMVGDAVALAAAVHTSLDAVQAGATLGPDSAGTTLAVSAGAGSSTAASGTTSASDALNGVGASPNRAPQFQQ